MFEQQSAPNQSRHQKLKRLTLWSFTGLVIISAIFGLIKLSAETNSSPSPNQSFLNSISPADWILGPSEAKVVLFEYSDFQCPACGLYFPLVKRINQEFSGKIQFVYRHFPLKQIHPQAELAARAAEAAGRQEKFWEMHDLLFENQATWSNQSQAKENFLFFAQTLELDLGRFKNDLETKEIKEKVENDFQNGQRSGVNATPTFFLNGQKIPNPRSYDEFRNLLLRALETNP